MADYEQPTLFERPAPERPARGQVLAVLKYLEQHGSLSDIEALDKLRIRRLAARIYDLRDRGYTIRTDMERHRGGEHARYVLDRRHRP